MQEIRFKPNSKNRTAEVVEALLQAQNGLRVVFEKGYTIFMGTVRTAGISLSAATVAVKRKSYFRC